MGEIQRLPWMSLWCLLLALMAHSMPFNARELNAFTYDSAQLPHDRNLIVHLFEWKWNDVAAECPYLAENGFGAVQISPPGAHVFDLVNVNGKTDYPWYFRYQPTGFSLHSRSGNETEFRAMVDVCNRVGVRIIVDVVLNHMAATVYAYDGRNASSVPRSSDGVAFSAHAGEEHFPDPPGYETRHFNDRKCNADISDYHDRNNVQYCRLVSLVDIDHSNAEVQDRIVTYLNRMLSLGVAGFRVDASKHMVARDIAPIFARLNALDSKVFGEDREPFLTHEVITHPDEPIQLEEYVGMGRVMSFEYGMHVTNAFRNQNGKTALNLLDIHEDSTIFGALAGHQLTVFLDNHDNQRYETLSHITHKNEWEYRLAAAFMMAHTYGVPRLMSSYIFDDVRAGPPNMGAPNYETSSPTRVAGGCEGGWVCEHRWNEIRRIIKWRSQMRGAAIAAIRYQSAHCFGFARLYRGYFALNNDPNNDCILNAVDTTLPAGTYCNVFAQDPTVSGDCNEANRVIVDNDGIANLRVSKRSVVAIAAPANASSKETKLMTAGSSPTLIFIREHVADGVNVFLRGGRLNQTQDCDKIASGTNACAIPIRHLLTDIGADKPSIVYDAFEMWRQGDDFLDFHGGESRQGTANGVWPQGTPTIYTTNRTSDPTFHPLNAKYALGDDHWLVVLDVNCARDPTFAVKGFASGKWESLVGNHIAMCGRANLFTWGVDGDRVLDTVK